MAAKATETNTENNEIEDAENGKVKGKKKKAKESKSIIQTQKDKSKNSAEQSEGNEQNVKDSTNRTAVGTSTLDTDKKKGNKTGVKLKTPKQKSQKDTHSKVQPSGTQKSQKDTEGSNDKKSAKTECKDKVIGKESAADKDAKKLKGSRKNEAKVGSTNKNEQLQASTTSIASKADDNKMSKSSASSMLKSSMTSVSSRADEILKQTRSNTSITSRDDKSRTGESPLSSLSLKWKNVAIARRTEREVSDVDDKEEAAAKAVLQPVLRGILKKVMAKETAKNVQFGGADEPSKTPTSRPSSRPAPSRAADSEDEEHSMIDGYGIQPTWTKMWSRALRKIELLIPGPKTPAEFEAQSDEKLQEIIHIVNAEMESGRVTELVPTVNGLKQFGIAKSGITRAVVNFPKPPADHPLTLCFHFPHTFLNHSYVRHMVLSQIRKIPNYGIIYIQYQDRNVCHGARAFDNRWIVKVANMACFEILRTQGIDVCNRKISMRPYNDILKEEYEEFREYVSLQKKYMYDQIKSLTGMMPSHANSIMHGNFEEQQPEEDKSVALETVVTSDEDSLVDYEDDEGVED